MAPANDHDKPLANDPDEPMTEEATGKAGTSSLMPDAGERRRLLEQVTDRIDRYLEELPSLPVAPPVSADEVRRHLAGYDLERPRPATEVLDDCADMLSRWILHSPHPRYFGLFNPTASFMGVLADALVAAFNPQVGVWHHAPAAVEIEQLLVRWIGARFGLAADEVAGTFTSGGSEANLTALLVALARAFPSYRQDGVAGLPGRPVFYASEDAHHSLQKGAQHCGLGRHALRWVPVDAGRRMDPAALAATIAEDRAAGHLPFLVVATAGTTAAGVVDPLEEIADVCAAERLLLHVDAAWGGAAILSDTLAPVLAGIGRADSITFDPHKWLSVPMACGMYLCRDRDALGNAFAIDAGYVERSPEAGSDAFVHGLQWSRRFIGLKLFATLATAGRSGYAEAIEQQARMADLLRELLAPHGWIIVNQTTLPIVCFADGRHGGAVDGDAVADRDAAAAGNDTAAADAVAHHRALARDVVARGRAWISALTLGSTPCLRACITSFLTGPQDIETLVAELDAAREFLAAENSPGASNYSVP